MIPVNRPLISPEDLDKVSSALEQTLISGDTAPIREFEEKLAETVGTKFAVAVSTGTTAIDLAIECLDIKPGDKCLLPTFTIMSTASNLMRKGAAIELVDSDPVTWSMDVEKTLSATGKDTKLIVPVHIYGLPVDLDPILKVTNEQRTFVLEDAAEALGVKYNGKMCGNIGDAGIFSFYANKVVTGGEGGAITTSDENFVNRLRLLRNLAFSPSERFVHNEIGWNYRWNGLSATLATSQLERLDKIIFNKQRIAEIYRNALEEMSWFDFQVSETSFSKNSYWVVGILIKEEVHFGAKELQEMLRANGVDSRRFFCPLHLQPVSKNYNIKTLGDMIISERLWNRGLYLPSGLGTTDEELEKVVSVIKELSRKI